MRVAKDDVDVRMEIPGAVIRQRTEFGDVRGFGKISGEYFTLSAGVDTTPLFQGLEGNLCQCPHWGFVLRGRITTTDAKGAQETVNANDLFYWPPGHNVKVDADAEIVMFSPQREHSHGHRPHDREGEGLAAGSSRLHRDRRCTDARPSSACSMRGMAMLLEHGYHDLGIQALLGGHGHPEGSFYHHFGDKEDFALQVIDQYMRQVHAGLDACLGDQGRPPLERVRRFFEMTQQSYRRGGLHGLPPGRARAGAVGRERGVPAQDRGVLLRHRQADRRLPGGGPEAEATSRPIPIRGAWRACWWTAGKGRRFAAGCGGMPRR